MHVIIVAVIALIVLIVLIAVFTGRFGGFSKGIGSFGNPALTCDGQGGNLIEVENLVKGGCPGGKVEIASRDSIAKGNKCCKKVTEEEKKPSSRKSQVLKKMINLVFLILQP